MKTLVLMMCLTGLVCLEEVTLVKRIGETVVLSVTEPQHNTTTTSFVWMYGQKSPIMIVFFLNNSLLIAKGTKFEQRLFLDKKSGSLTISNLTINDTGVFHIQIMTATGKIVSNKEYNLTVTGNIVLIPALEGSNVTLKTNMTHLDDRHHIFWTTNDFTGKQIAKWENNVTTYDEELKDFLFLDTQTGSLTIVHIPKWLTEFFCVRMLFGRESHSDTIFQVHVYAVVSTPHISTAEHSLHTDEPWSCQVNCSVQNSDDVVLTWYKGDKVLNSSSDTDMSTNLTLSLNVPLDSSVETYRCEAANPVSKRAMTFNTTYWCPKHHTDWSRERNIRVGVVVGVVLIVLVIAFVVNRCRRCQRLR